jgi:hypothetical protein
MIPFAQWQAERLSALTARDGWLNLVDRIEFPPGRHRVGQGIGCDIQLSRGPAFLGWLIYLPPAAPLFEAASGAKVYFEPTEGGGPRADVAPFLLEIHSAGASTALRVRDSSSDPAASFAGLRTFPHDPAWIIRARWERLDAPRALQIDMKSGTPETIFQTHVARFEIFGQAVTLVPTHLKAGRPMFVIRDATSGKQTYAASRFLIAEPEGDAITLDFNRAHNPPCAFSDFAICPLPPPQNRLPFAVVAGELSP